MQWRSRGGADDGGQRISIDDSGGARRVGGEGRGGPTMSAGVGGAV
jgi:hypothetical protein